MRVDSDERRRRRRARERRADEAFFDGLLLGTYWRESQAGQRNEAVDQWLQDEADSDVWDDMDDFGDDMDFFD